MPESVFWSLFGLYFHQTIQNDTIDYAVSARFAPVTHLCHLGVYSIKYENSPARFEQGFVISELTALFKEFCHRIARTLLALCEVVAIC